MEMSWALPKFWKVEMEPAETLHNLVGQWHLESPATGSQASAEQHSIDISVWALAANPQSQGCLRLVVRLPGRTFSLGPCDNRPDVVEAILNTDPEGHQQLKCGYKISVPAADAWQGFEIGFETDGLIHSAAKVFLD